VKRARAKEAVALELSATNVGDGPYSQLIAVGQSELSFLSNIEFPFGALAPGETRSFAVPIELPEGLATQDIPIDIEFREGNGRVPEPFTAILPVEELKKPSFAFEYRVSPAGGAVAMGVKVTNAGQGATSPETAATLTDDCGDAVSIESGRAKLGSMPPGSSRNASFRFRALGSAEEDCRLKLTIADIKRYEVLTGRIRADLSRGSYDPPPGRRYAPPSIEAGPVPTSTAEGSIRISGRVVDSDEVRDIFAFAGDKKVAYIPNASGGTEMSFSIEAPLEPGPNTIVIGARDSTDLLSRKIVVVNRTSGERKRRIGLRDEGPWMEKER